MRTEIWRTAIVNGEPYENYEVSNFGQILSLNYRNTGKAKLLKLGKNTNGYLHVALYKNGKTKRYVVHRLVAETFIPNPENLPEVNHKDEDKTNNSVENLEWILHKDNCNHGTRNERVAKANSKVQKNNQKKSKKVLQFTLDGILVKEWPSTAECGRNGFKQSAVARCCRGEKLYYKGFRWGYA